jgi:hypothetical protein
MDGRRPLDGLPPGMPQLVAVPLWTCGEYRGACASVPARSPLLDVSIIAIVPGMGD